MKYNLFFFVFIYSVVNFSSCTKNQENLLDPAVIELNPKLDTIYGFTGDTIKISVNVQSKAKLIGLEIFKTVDNGGSTPFNNVLSRPGEKSMIYDFVYVLSSEDLNKKVIFDFTALEEGVKSESVRSITIFTIDVPKISIEPNRTTFSGQVSDTIKVKILGISSIGFSKLMIYKSLNASDYSLINEVTLGSNTKSIEYIFNYRLNETEINSSLKIKFILIETSSGNTIEKEINIITYGPPVYRFNPDSLNFQGIPGDNIHINIFVKAFNLDAIEINKIVDNSLPTQIARITDFANVDSIQTDFNYTFQASEINKIVQFDFTIFVNDSSYIVRTIGINTNSPPARRYTAVLLNPPLGDKSAKSFFSTSTGHTYSPDSINASVGPVSADVDFGYFYGATEHASLASPAAWKTLAVSFSNQVVGWSHYNDIVLKSTNITSSQFIELSTMKDIDDAFASGTDAGDIMTGLTEGQVIAFSTDANKSGGSKKGLMIVKTIHGIYNYGDYIELEIIVQEHVQ